MTSTGDPAAPRKYTPRLPRDQRTDQILDAVLEVISEEGTSAVSVDGIARRLGFTRPVVYALFTDANHLLRACLKREEQLAIAQIVDVLPIGASGEPDAIEDALRVYLEAVRAHPARWRAILLPVRSNPALMTSVRRGREHFVDLLTTIADSVLPPGSGLDPRIAAHMVLSLGEEAGRMVLTDPESFTPEGLAGFAGTAARMISSALRTPGPA